MSIFEVGFENRAYNVILVSFLIVTGLLCLFKSAIADTKMRLTVGEAIRIALLRNPGLRSQKMRLLAQGERKAAARVDRFPKLEAGYRYAWLQDEPYIRFKDFPGIDEIPFGKNHEAEWYIQFVQPIFTGFALETREALEDLGVDIKEVELELSRLNLRFEVKRAYLLALVAGARLGSRKKTVEALKAHLHDAKAMYEQGLIAKNDVLRAEVAYRAALEGLEEARGELETKKAYLKSLLSLEPETEIGLSDMARWPDDGLYLKDCFEMALKERPEVRALRLSIQGAKLQRRIAMSSFYPTVNLVGRYEQSGDDVLARRNDFRNSRNSMLVLQANWRFFEWGKTRHAVKEAEYKVKALEKRLMELKNRIYYEIKKARISIRTAKANVETARAALLKAREDLRLTKLRYRERLADTSDVLDAERYLAGARENLIAARYGYLLAVAGLERAIGRDFYEWK